MGTFNKILIIRNDHIGDLVLSTPVFRELKKKYSSSKIILITSKINKDLVKKDPHLDGIWELDMPRHNIKNILKYMKMSWKIRKEKFDAGIDLRGSLQISFFLLWLSGIEKRVGKSDNYPNKFLNWVTSLFQTNAVRVNFHPYKRHITKDNFEIINKGLKINLKNNWPKIFTDVGDEKDVEKFIKENRLKRYICICPFTDLADKQWDKNNFKELVLWLKEFDYNILLIGPIWQEAELQELARENSNSQVVLGFNLRKASILFKKSKLVIAQDGGPFHIAWISGAKTIELVRRFPKELAAGKFRALKNAKTIWAKGKDINEISVKEVKEKIKQILKD